jgi:hypothetical protein
MLRHVTRDTSLVPALAETGAREYAQAARDVAAGPYRRALVGLALSFTTWDQLTRVLTDEQAAALLLDAIAGPRRV